MAWIENSWLIQIFAWIDTSTTMSSLFVVGISAYIAHRFILRPKITLETRETEQGKTMLLATSKGIFSYFEAKTVHFFILIPKEIWEEGFELKCKPKGKDWGTMSFDVQWKNVNKKEFAALAGYIELELYPKRPTIFVLINKKPAKSFDMYYSFSTKRGTYPANASPKIIETGKLPKISFKQPNDEVQ